MHIHVGAYGVCLFLFNLDGIQITEIFIGKTEILCV